ncbi:hypothetical protein CKO18_14915 [Rhodoferax fermentans]|nr:hypothetical protein [Rhodoferax fermentans]
MSMSRASTRSSSSPASPKPRRARSGSPVWSFLLSAPSTTGPLTMTSRDIAEYTGKDHKHVLADIRNMLDQLGLTSADFSANLPDTYGRPQPGFRLPKDLTITLVSGYSVPMRHAIVTRWQELEAQQAPARWSQVWMSNQIAALQAPNGVWG